MSERVEKALDHFRNPRNLGEVSDPDGVGVVGPDASGDEMRVTFRLGPDQRIADIKFKVFGCVSSIAPTSALTEMVRGTTVEDAERVSNEDIARYLGVPDQKMYGAVTGRDALAAAVRDCRQRRSREALT